MIEHFLDKIHHNDCLDFMPQLPDDSIDSVITDPPYNLAYQYHEYKDNLDWQEYFNWQLKIVQQAARLLKSSGSLLWLNYPEVAARMWALISEQVPELQPVKWITWIYHQHTGGKPLRRATRAWLWFSKGEPYIGEDALGGIYRNPTDKRIREMILLGHQPVDYDWWFYEQVKNVSMEKTQHPCQLPLAMVLRLVEMVTPKGGIVLDPFCGSGTTPVAAKKSACRWIGIESDAAYVELATKRLKVVPEDQLL